MEVADNAELFDFIADPGKGFPERLARFYFIQLISGLKAIHEQKFAHRDLKTENIFLDKDFNLKIGDFGFAKYFEEGSKLKTVLGTVGYQSPELLEGKGYNGFANDIFACGVILFIFANAYPPFKEAKVKDPWYKNIYTGDFKKFWELHQKRLVVKSEAFKTLISGMLNRTHRWTIEEILACEWFNGELPTKDELLTDMSARKKIVDLKKRKNEEEKHKAKAANGETKVYRGDGDEVDMSELNKWLEDLDVSGFKSETKEVVIGKGDAMKFESNIESGFKQVLLSLKTYFAAEIEMIPNRFEFNAKVANWKHFEDEVECEEDVGINVELLKAEEGNCIAIIGKDDSTNIFTFKRFVEEFKSKFVKEDK